MARVIVSAGHTNSDPGTIVSSIREVDLTRKIAKAVTKELRDQNILTLAVPPELDLARRIAWINQTGYSEANNDVAIEIHINEGGKSGIESWHQADKPNSQKLTESIANAVSKSMGWQNQGVKSEYTHEFGSLAFLHNTTPIASLIECGYMDNPKDLEILKDDSKVLELAKAIAKGIQEFINSISPSTNQIKKQDEEKTNKRIEDEKQDISQPADTAQSSTTPPTISSAPMSPAPVATAPVVTQNSFQSSSFGSTPTNNINNYSIPSNNSYSTGFGSPAPAAGGTSYMSRDERKEMIKKNYIKILGREPNQSDLNYFLNIGISEDQLVKKMVDSQEHADLVKARQEVIEVKQKFKDQNTELLQLRAKTNDQKGIIQNLNRLLMQKNYALHQMHDKLNSLTGDPAPKTAQKVANRYPKSFSQKVLDYFTSRWG